ncbi:MAG: hypothetical protein JWQ11_1681 [Rhizobacter sp.]|nr:hypothetical protein [Rhizobacter sp.]
MPLNEDIIDLALRPGPELQALRNQRDLVRVESQLSFHALLGELQSPGLTSLERFTVAERVASLHRSEALAAHYMQSMHLRGTAEPTARLQAMLRHAELLSTDPAQAGPEQLAALAEAGLGPAEIVTLSQLIGFVSYQARVVAGLSLLQKGAA